MSFRRFLGNALLNALDPALLVTTFMILYLLNAVVSLPILDALSAALVEFVSTGSLLKFIYSFYSSVATPIGVLSLLLSVFLNVYLFGFLIARVWQKRTGEKINPFALPLRRWFHTFISLVFVVSPVAILLLLYAFYQPFPVGKVFFFLALFSLFFWVPLAFPVPAASVVERERGRDIVYEGLLAGRLYWWKILLSVVVFSFLISLLSYLLSPLLLPPLDLPLSVLLSTLVTIWMGSLSAEAYYGFKYGE